MTPDSFEIRRFTSDNLSDALRTDRYLPTEAAERRASYLYEYLDHLGAQTIIVEREYVDGDYLEDFAAYYVRCFKGYSRFCNRLHFFSSEVDEDKFLEAVQADPSNNPQSAHRLDEDYLGFVVARPLPQAVIGRSVLKTYSRDKTGGTRHYKAVLDYTAHLFGVPLTVRSLAFQEQDHVLAACATVALWAAFHMTHDLFGTARPRPAVITEAANQVLFRSRPIPSDGLTVRQISHAIREVGLEPEVFPVTNEVPLSSLLYGYLSFGLPVILLVELENIGGHAITVAGYSLRDDPAIGREVDPQSRQVPSIGLRIDEFYAHDDQVGPFSRLEVKAATKGQAVSLEGGWTDASGDTVSMRPRVAVVPVYDKIRITYVDVEVWIKRLSEVLPLVIPRDQLDKLEWDIRLTTTNRFKGALRREGLGSQQVGRTLLLQQQPRFIWRCVLRFDGKRLFELLIDATDMGPSFQIYAVIWRQKQFASALKGFLTDSSLEAPLKRVLTSRFYDFLKANLP